ncbi:hypothetical protein [Paraglaciecola sp. MB-3u-78]|uniref:hypothetical protein n=1 Tax=Paraglaciecola sp. MB-3u-78 TaxID=2058332 RepID=UPI000C328591|nr:hypothetical protein [Paraglaciecola sp. MB-3u-78]PKH00709.1 hypothetical protein CXF95_00285 [Paraglaciecola sp. MB-3u-78]
MNKHTRTAFMVAPILAVIGYIAADYYEEDQAEKEKVIQLVPVEGCDVINQKCILRAGDFEVNVFDKDNLTTVNSTFPLDSATIFLVDKNNQPTAYPLGMIQSPYYWHTETNLRELIGHSGQSYKLRLVAKIKGGRYISEFYTTTK